MNCKYLLRFIILAIWTSIHILLRLFSVASPYGRLLLLSNRCRANNRNDVSTVVKKCYYGDWFLLTQVTTHSWKRGRFQSLHYQEGGIAQR